jgi:hypothetical protein
VLHKIEVFMAGTQKEEKNRLAGSLRSEPRSERQSQLCRLRRASCSWPAAM